MFAPAAGAASFSVTNLNASGPGSLAQAIDDANNAAGLDTITFDPTLVGTITPGKLIISDSVSIIGPGADRVTVDGEGTSDLFYIWKSGSTLDVSISGLTVTGSNAYGGIVSWGENLTIDSVVVTGNSGDAGGGIELYNNEDAQPTLTIRNTVITDNTATNVRPNHQSGGVFAYDAGAVVLDHVTVSDNNGYYGGGVFLKDPMSTVTVSSSTIANNHSDEDGGGLLIESPADVVSIVGSTITGNTAEDSGGGVYVSSPGSSVYVSSTTLSNNTAASSSGGLGVNGARTVGLDQITVSGNHASDGAGINVARNASGSYTTTLSSSTISGNAAISTGGGVRSVGKYERITVLNTTIDGNSAATGGGAYIDSYGLFGSGASSGYFESSTISNNTATTSGGGIQGNRTYVSLFQSTISGNSAPNGSAIDGVGKYANFFGPHTVPTTIQIGHSTIASNTSSAGATVEGTITDAYVVSSILSGNTSSTGDVSNDRYLYAAYDLVENVGTSGITATHGNIVGTAAQLRSLQDNGGPTFTMLPDGGSPAIDAGDPTVTSDDFPDGDQRGFLPRVVGAAIDMGAVEVGATDPHPAPATGGGGPAAPEVGAQQLPSPGSDGDSSSDVHTSEGVVRVTVHDADGSGAVTVTVRDAADVAEDEQLNGFNVVGKVFEVEVTGTTFGTVSVCFPYDAADVAAAGLTESELQLFHLHNGVREAVPTTVDTTTHQVCGTVDSLSPFVIGSLATDRLAGTTAAGTAAAISHEAFDPGVDAAYLVTSAGYADALGAGPAAAAKGAPVLLVTKDAIPAETRAELDRLNPSKIIVIGGTGVISDAVATDAGQYGAISRVAGADRYETAVLLSKATFSPGVSTAYVVRGDAFPDGLVAGAAAAGTGGPVLLTQTGALPASTKAELERLKPGRIVIVGGTGAVSTSVENELKSIATTTRVAGADRYTTSAQVAKTFADGSPVVAATGEKASDALAGVPLAALDDAALVLVKPDEIPADVADALDALHPPTMRVLGGTAAISLQNEVDLASFLPED